MKVKPLIFVTGTSFNGRLDYQLELPLHHSVRRVIDFVTTTNDLILFASSRKGLDFHEKTHQQLQGDGGWGLDIQRELHFVELTAAEIDTVKLAGT